MTREKWEKVKAIFHEAYDLAEGDRPAFIAAQCGDDETMLCEVHSLFNSHNESKELFESPAFESISRLVAEDLPSRIGQVIGNYKIESEIGRGGMGAVYLASRADAEFDKKVAIKLIKRGFDTDEVIKRFRHERQILAALEHPNITHLLDGGSTDDGLPFIVMDYVDGRPLHRYADELGLSINQRLEIFLKICAAVEYAHQNLIIHRDLKPSNILVTSDGEPKLLDFGIARLTGPSADGITVNNTLTKFAAMTPEYASPEQLVGRPVTTASDIYSLGILLYELLTGHRPFRFATDNVLEISAMIADTAPTKPSTACRQLGVKTATGNTAAVIRRLRGDLDNIVMMAIRRDAHRRYSSVEQFAGDIRRYLGGHPVIARQDTFAYRAAKFAGRNKVGVVSALGIGASLVGGLFAVSRQARIASTQRDRARAEARKAEKVNLFLQEMLSSADPRKYGHDAKLTDIISIAAGRIAAEFGDQPEIAADLYSTIGRTLLSQGKLDAAERYLSDALDLRRRLFGTSHMETARSTLDFAQCLSAKGSVDEAERLFAGLLEPVEEHFSYESVEMANLLYEYARVKILQGKHSEAIEICRRELTLRQRLIGDGHETVARSLLQFGDILAESGETDSGEKMHRRALSIVNRNFPDDHLDKAMALQSLFCSIQHKAPLEAEELINEALRIKRKLLGLAHPETAWSIYHLSFIKLTTGNVGAAEQLSREILAFRGNVLGEENILIGNSLSILGRSLLGQGRIEEAEAALRDCLDVRRRYLDSAHWMHATTMGLLGECLVRAGRPEIGRELLRASHHQLLAKLGPNHARTLDAVRRLLKVRTI